MKEKHQILYIDNTPQNLMDFKSVFEDEYDIFLSRSIAKSYKLIKQNNIPIIISDTQVFIEEEIAFTHLKGNFSYPFKFFLCGENTLHLSLDINDIYYYFQRPWDKQNFRMVIRNALEAIHLKKLSYQERAEREEVFRENEERIRIVAKAMSDLVWVVDEDGRYLEMLTSPKYETRKNLRGKKLTEILPEVESQEIIRIIRKTIKQRAQHRVVYEVPLGNNQKRWFEGKTTLLDKKFNDKQAVIFVVRDITEQKIAEQKLEKYQLMLEELIKKRTQKLRAAQMKLELDIGKRKQTEEELKKLSQAIEQSPVSVMITDKLGHIEYVNPHFCKVTGYSMEEIIGEHPKVLRGGNLPEYFYDKLWETILSGQTWNGDFINRTKYGEEFWETASIAPITNEDGEITHFVGVKQDITEKKALERELLEAKETAETAVLIKSTFLANMSHEIRTPMSAILGFLDLTLEDSSLSKIQYTNLSKAKKAAKGLLHLINEILDVSKLESGKLELEKYPFDLKKLLENIFTLLDVMAEEKKLQLFLQIDPKVPQHVVGDPTRLKQVILNLTGNAIKFTERGSVTLRVKPFLKNMLLFTIIDTGIGIPQENLGGIFEAFKQVEEVTSRRFGGTGLGTTIAKQIVELMDGKIWVESEVGRGSEFNFMIPLPKTTQKPIESETEKIKARYRRTFHILLAEDIEDNITLLTLRLEERGHTITVARNGKEAIELFKKEKFDLILMDVHMPKIDGIEATFHIRKMEKFTDEHIPIIALTASVMKNEMDKYWEVGMDEVVSKPIHFNYLFQIMDKVTPPNKGTIVQSKQSKPDSIAKPIIALEGIDVQKGLKIWKNSKAYTMTLANFTEKYANIVQEICDLIKKQDLNGIHHIAHSLKGIAGNLAITDVFQLATEIEFAAREKKLALIENKLGAFSSALQIAIASIKKLNKSKGKSSKEQEKTKKRLKPNEIEQLFRKMFMAFEEYNPCTIEPFINTLKNSFEQKDIDPIEKHVQGFDFQSAKKEAMQFAQKLGIELPE